MTACVSEWLIHQWKPENVLYMNLNTILCSFNLTYSLSLKLAFLNLGSVCVGKPFGHNTCVLKVGTAKLILKSQ